MGTVIANRAGFGFVRVEGMEDNVFLPPPEMAGLVHGDRVRIAVTKDAQQRYSGRVLQIVERSIQAFLGIVEKSGHGWQVRAADRRLNLLCRIEDGAGLNHGDWIIAAITSYPRETEPGVARLQQRLDPDRPVQMATVAAIARFGLPQEFSAEAVREAERWGNAVDPAETARRVDLRSLPLVTIDGEDARDFDDAVYAEQLEDGFRLVVAIADVSHYVRPGSALDAEARARGTSVYFPDRVLPMLPHALSDQLCSLQPQVDRLCMVADMQISRRGLLRETRCYPAVMCSAARLTYGQAHAALFERKVAERNALGALVEKLEPLVEVYRVLQKARSKRGALDFDAPEAGFELREGEQVHAIRFASRNDAHKLIEECMVLANVAVAQQLRKARIPALFRVHAPPEERKLETLRATLRVLNIELTLPAREEVQTRDLAAIAPRIRDQELRPFVESLVVRSLAQALYQPENIGHFGLALQDYAHFTSPIRRYPDLLIHRALRVMLDLQPASTLPEPGTLDEVGADLSRLEKRADEADRYVDTFLKCVYLRDRIGQRFEGLITTVTEFGCFVQLLEVGVDGLLHMSSLGADDFQLARDGGRWLSRRTGRQLAPGQKIAVMVTAVRPVEGMVDLEPADD